MHARGIKEAPRTLDLSELPIFMTRNLQQGLPWKPYAGEGERELPEDAQKSMSLV
jgi:hypothetical protein